MRTFLFISVFVLGCATQPKQPSSQVASKRRPAQASDFPPVGTTVDGWAFSWTSKPIPDPAAYVGAELARGMECVKKIAVSEDPVEHCEGDRMAAGPGLYTCDNPFTSHDYGSILIGVKIKADRHSVGLATGSFTPPPASGGMDRSIYGRAEYSGLLYAFRYSDLNTRALVLRGDDVVDVAASYAVPVRPAAYAVFVKHEPFVCTGNTEIKDVLLHWGDQMEYLSLMYDSFRDPSGDGYFTKGKLNSAAFAAAIASDATAAADGVLNQRLTALKAKVPEIAESMTDVSCQETDANSVRSCLARRVFDSLVGNMGSGSHPTYAWSVPALKQALSALKVAGPADVAANSREALFAKMVASYASAAPRMTLAFQCVMAVRARVAKWHFGLWGADPQ